MNAEWKHTTTALDCELAWSPVVMLSTNCEYTNHRDTTHFRDFLFAGVIVANALLYEVPYELIRESVGVYVLELLKTSFNFTVESKMENVTLFKNYYVKEIFPFQCRYERSITYNSSSRLRFLTGIRSISAFCRPERGYAVRCYGDNSVVVLPASDCQPR